MTSRINSDEKPIVLKLTGLSILTKNTQTTVYDPKEAGTTPNVAVIAKKVLQNPLANLITIISFPRNCIEDVGIIIANCFNVEWLNLEGNLISGKNSDLLALNLGSYLAINANN